MYVGKFDLLSKVIEECLENLRDFLLGKETGIWYGVFLSVVRPSTDGPLPRFLGF